MSVRDEFGLECPICHHDDRIEVTFTGTCRLTGSGSVDNGDHEWDESSPCACNHCEYVGTVADFTYEERKPLVRDDREAWMQTIWKLIDFYETYGGPPDENEGNDLRSMVAWMREDLDLPSEIDVAKAKEADEPS